MNYNKVIIVGRLTRDPEVRTIPDSGLSVASVGVATNHYYKDKSGETKDETEFHNVTLFGNLANTASNYLKKGSLALFEGRLRTSSWEGKEDGVKRNRTEIVVEKMQLPPKNMSTFSGESSSNNESNSQNNTYKQESSKKEIPVIDEDDDIDVKDIPF